MKNSAHYLKVQEWIDFVVGRNASRFAKREELKRFVAQNLSAGQVVFSEAETAFWAAKQVQFVSSAYDSAKDAFKANFSVYRGAYTATCNHKHFANR